MTRTAMIASAAVLAGCSQLGNSSNQETYQRLLALLCQAPPSVMQGVLTTDQLKTAWTFICGHVGSVPATPVTTTWAGPPGKVGG